MCKKDELLEYVIQDIIDMVSTDWSIEYDEAKNKFYNSEVFEKLIDEETGLYLESPDYVYDLFKDEMILFRRKFEIFIQECLGIYSDYSLQKSTQRCFSGEG